MDNKALVSEIAPDTMEVSVNGKNIYITSHKVLEDMERDVINLLNEHYGSTATPQLRKKRKYTKKVKTETNGKAVTGAEIMQELTGKKKRGRPKKIWATDGKEMAAVAANEKDEE